MRCERVTLDYCCDRVAMDIQLGGHGGDQITRRVLPPPRYANTRAFVYQVPSAITVPGSLLLSEITYEGPNMQSLLYGRIRVAYSDSGDLAWTGLEASRGVLGGYGDVATTLPRVSDGVESRRGFSGSNSHYRGPGTSSYADAP